MCVLISSFPKHKKNNWRMNQCCIQSFGRSVFFGCEKLRAYHPFSPCSLEEIGIYRSKVVGRG